jgi:hypothetical protein
VIPFVQQRNQEVKNQLDYCSSQADRLCNEELAPTSFLLDATNWLASQTKLESILLQIQQANIIKKS